MTNYEEYKYDTMVELGIATIEEMNLVKNIKGGTWTEVIDAIVSVRTGYNSFEQYWDCEIEPIED